VNPGGEPERDDTGLPPVDIEVPDDARELDRDVQAYRRELRALRRSDRRGRLHRSLSKDGVALPLLACCLILALITGTLLTVFTATSNQTGLPGSGPSASTRSSAPRLQLVADQPLPNAELAVDGAAAASIQVQMLDEAMLVLVPANCRCVGTFHWLAEVASKARVPVYVIYTPATKPEVQQLRSELSNQLRGWIKLAEESDTQNLLSPARFPAGIPAGQLAAILVGPHELATWVSHMSPNANQTPLLKALTT
jgi:hypothetical protein